VKELYKSVAKFNSQIVKEEQWKNNNLNNEIDNYQKCDSNSKYPMTEKSNVVNFFFIFIYYLYFIVIYLLGCYTFYKNVYPPVVNTFHPLLKNENVYEYMFANNSDGRELYIF